MSEGFKVWVGGADRKMVLVGPQMRISAMFDHPDSFRSLGLGLIDVANVLEVEGGSVIDQLDPEDAELAIKRWQHLIEWGISESDCEDS